MRSHHELECRRRRFKRHVYLISIQFHLHEGRERERVREGGKWEMGNGKWEMGEKKVHFHVDQLWRRSGLLAHLFLARASMFKSGHDGDDDDDAWWVHHHPIQGLS